VMGANAYLLFAALGAWLDAGVNSAQRIQFDMLPWIVCGTEDVRADLARLLLSCRQPEDVAHQTINDNNKRHYFLGDELRAHSYTGSWIVEVNQQKLHMQAVCDLVCAADGYSKWLSRKQHFAKVGALLPARGIVLAIADSVTCPMQLKPNVLDIPSLVLPPPLALYNPPQTPALIRKAILCWRSLLFELGYRRLSDCVSNIYRI
jgi:hypothetical protein